MSSQRSLLRALGWTDSEMKKPLVGIICAQSEIIPGHMHLNEVARAAAEGVIAAGGKPVIVPSIGVCAGIAGLMESSMIAAADPHNAGLNMEMDAILSVALGGTLLSGGKFYVGGSIIGAITIQTMTTTLYALGVSSEQLPVYKALVVILICLLQSEKFKNILEKRAVEKAVKQG